MNTPPADPSVPRPPRLLDQLRERIGLKHYRLRTERAYARWVKRYIYFHGKRHPVELRKEEVTALLTWLAVERSVAASTQRVAHRLGEAQRSPCTRRRIARGGVRPVPAAG